MRLRALPAAVTLAAVLGPAASVGAEGELTGTIVIKVTVSTGCGPAYPDNSEPPPRPFDAYIRVRNRDTGRRWVIASGDDGRIRRRFPVGRYRILPGEPRGGGIEYSKDRVYLDLGREEIERARVRYDNGCL